MSAIQISAGKACNATISYDTNKYKYLAIIPGIAIAAGITLLILGILGRFEAINIHIHTAYGLIGSGIGFLGLGAISGSILGVKYYNTTQILDAFLQDKQKLEELKKLCKLNWALIGDDIVGDENERASWENGSNKIQIDVHKKYYPSAVCFVSLSA